MPHNILIVHYGEDEAAVDSVMSRLTNMGFSVQVCSIEEQNDGFSIAAHAVIERHLRIIISQATIVIILIGESTHESECMAKVICHAHRIGKTIVGVYVQGVGNDTKIPEVFKRCGGPILGNDSLDKLPDIISGQCPPPEKPDGSERETPIFPIKPIKC